MWDGKSHDRIRALRFKINLDQQHLECAPLGPIQKKDLQKTIDLDKAELKILNKEKREKKKLQKSK